MRKVRRQDYVAVVISLVPASASGTFVPISFAYVCSDGYRGNNDRHHPRQGGGKNPRQLVAQRFPGSLPESSLYVSGLDPQAERRKSILIRTNRLPKWKNAPASPMGRICGRNPTSVSEIREIPRIFRKISCMQ